MTHPLLTVHAYDGDTTKDYSNRSTMRILRQSKSSTLPYAAVWERIKPAVPDVLNEIAPGVYEARWWQPVPEKEIETLLQLAPSEGLIILDAPYEPETLPQGIAVRFRLQG